MKNMFKFLGIITILVMIGVVVSCDMVADAEDQIIVTITGLPSGANDNYARILLYNPDLKAQGAISRKIANNSVTNDIVYYAPSSDNNGKAFGNDGDYKITLKIYSTEASPETDIIYTGGGTSAVHLKKGNNQISVANLFLSPDITNVFPSTVNPPLQQPPATNFGTYTTSYSGTVNGSAGTVTEIVELTATSFNISDNAAGTTAPDSLNFRIDEWETVTTGLPTGYTGGYKFTGKILSQKNYIPSTKTAPAASGFSTSTVATDVKADGSGTTCWMYIYFKGETGSITFVRSAFSRTGSTENKAVVTGNDNADRVYTKQ